MINVQVVIALTKVVDSEVQVPDSIVPETLCLPPHQTGRLAGGTGWLESTTSAQAQLRHLLPCHCQMPYC